MSLQTELSAEFILEERKESTLPTLEDRWPDGPEGGVRNSAPSANRPSNPCEFVLGSRVNLESELRMATTSTSFSSSPSRLRSFRLAVYFLGAILVFLAAGLVWLYSVARSALPRLDGRVRVSGL